MNKKIIISAISAIVLAAGGITGYVWYKNSLHPAYGKYSAYDYNGMESYITLDEKNITFTNVDFSSYEKSAAVYKAYNEINNSGETEDEDFETKHKRMNERAKEIQKTLDYDSAFNGYTFDATDYEKGDMGELYLIVYDEKNDYEIWLDVYEDERVIRCGSVSFEYEG